jgi:hypothetical protein
MITVVSPPENELRALCRIPSQEYTMSKRIAGALALFLLIGLAVGTPVNAASVWKVTSSSCSASNFLVLGGLQPADVNVA